MSRRQKAEGNKARRVEGARLVSLSHVIDMCRALLSDICQEVASFRGYNEVTTVSSSPVHLPITSRSLEAHLLAVYRVFVERLTHSIRTIGDRQHVGPAAFVISTKAIFVPAGHAVSKATSGLIQDFLPKQKLVPAGSPIPLSPCGESFAPTPAPFPPH